MSRSKEATVVLLDAGASMLAPLRERNATRLAQKHVNTRFDAAVTTVESVLQQKLLFKPKDEVGIVLFGTAETKNQLNEDQGDDEYTNVTVVAEIDTPTLSMCQRIRTVQPTSDASVQVDLLDGLIVALDLLYRRTNGKKYEKRLLLLTDAASKIQDASDVESVVEMLHNMDVKLQIVGIDFTHTTDKEKELIVPETVVENALKEEPPTLQTTDAPTRTVIKQENEKMLVSIAREVGGEVSSASKRMHLLAQGMKKTVALTTKFRGGLEIGNDLSIPVFCYLKTKLATLPTLVKESQASHEPDVSGKVRMDRRYTSPQNPDEEVPPDQQVKAYRYGLERVPFSSADVEFFKLQTEKSLKLLGFVDRKLVSLTRFIAGTDVFVAEPGKHNAAQALAALVDGMIATNQIAVARFVARKNAAPKIIALVPHHPTLSENFFCLWGHQLPYEEDVRNYEFAPLNTKKHAPTASQQDIADRLVESLSVRSDKAHDVGRCFNPVLRRFYRAVEQRAMDTQPESASALPTFVDTNLDMDEARKIRIDNLIQNFGDAFQLKEAVKKQKERKKKAFWSDVPSSTAVKQEGGGAGGAADVSTGGPDMEDGNDDADGSDLDLDDLLDGGDVTTVGSMNPIADFETLVELGSRNKERLVIAVTGMQTQISTFFARGEAFYPKALQCLSHFRKRSVAIQYASEFNEFLTELKESLGMMSSGWAEIQKEGITLFSQEEDPSVATTASQARVFLYGEEKVDLQVATASLSSQVEEMEDEDDMFADFE